MLEELDKLILFILDKYNEIFEEWKKSDLYIPINQKEKLVKDIDNDILNTILNYRHFINANNLELKLLINDLDLLSTINTRVKTQNSIEFKINNYRGQKHEFGKIPINKCFNDLYGIRIILPDDINHKFIEEFIKNKYDKKLKCINASKGDYVATHIYFKINNYSFQWELQVWDKKHEKSNIISHERYKQEYTKWEKENKGGEPS